ncbi:MAG TPA: hypothetical protein VLJ76_06455 [Gaiellaceae bacterium]|nr:hypothetical protein [Gaiellaceae bacterium]
MRGIRWLLRDFTARAVREHLRSQVDDRAGAPELTPNEVELVRFVRDNQFGAAEHEPK